jgi:prefoldin subunit 5
MPGFASPFDPWGASAVTPEQEVQFLKAEARQIREELEAIEKRIQELETEDK